jgi:hypothetical protein
MITKHIHLDLDINFEERVLSGVCVLSIEKEEPSGTVFSLVQKFLSVFQSSQLTSRGTLAVQQKVI